MSRKTKLAVEPGRELDWDDENDRRHLEEEAFASLDEHPKPTMPPPERSRWWWFWRAFGMFVYKPARKALLAFMAHRWVNSDYVRGIPGHEVYTWPFGRALHQWINHPGKAGPRARKLRQVLYWITTIHHYSQCMDCGFTELEEEHTIYAHPDDTEGRTINMFEFLEGGGVDYFGEAEDAYGWMWCYRCGSVSWEAA